MLERPRARELRQVHEQRDKGAGGQLRQLIPPLQFLCDGRRQDLPRSVPAPTEAQIRPLLRGADVPLGQLKQPEKELLLPALQ